VRIARFFSARKIVSKIFGRTDAFLAVIATIATCSGNITARLLGPRSLEVKGPPERQVWPFADPAKTVLCPFGALCGGRAGGLAELLLDRVPIGFVD
jgi:hypothetical protein